MPATWGNCQGQLYTENGNRPRAGRKAGQDKPLNPAALRHKLHVESVLLSLLWSGFTMLSFLTFRMVLYILRHFIFKVCNLFFGFIGSCS